MHIHQIAANLAENVEQVAIVEAHLDIGGGIIGRHFFGRGAVFRAGDRQCHLVPAQRQLHRAGLFGGGDGGHAVHAFGQHLGIDLQQLVVRRRDHAGIIREGAVDQLAGQRRIRREAEPDFRGRQADFHRRISGHFIQQLAHFVHAFARHDHTRHVGRAIRQIQLDAGKAVAIGGNAAQLGRRASGGMQIDAIQIITGFLGGDRELHRVDQFLQLTGRKREAHRQIGFGDHREIIALQRRQAEPAAAGIHAHAVTRNGEFNLRALGQLAHDIEQRVRRNRGGAVQIDRGGDIFHHLQIKIGRHQPQPIGARFDQHVGKDRDGVATLHHRLDMAQALQQGCALNGGLHSDPCNEMVKMAAL